jgi:hypothetical protein
MKLSERKNLMLACSLLLVIKSNALADEVQFNRDIRPILANHCFACHGPDAAPREAELRLDLEAAAKADRDPQIIVAHNAKASELVNRISTADHDLVMPPVEFDKPLSTKQKILLAQWIEQGAPWDDHWAFVSPTSPPLPTAKQEWVNNAVDQFVVTRIRELNSGLRPSPIASRATLIRRLSFDLRGLPPTIAEVTGFIASGDYESVVDKMLASEQFGERLGMHWLDLVRYADSGGYHSDVPIHISPYRDYVIQAFNENMPFDQFTREQLAGDLLLQPTQRQIIATGYNRLNKTTEEGGAQPGEYLTKYAADRVRTTAGTWLGLTLGCCECHDHKYDPFTTKDFYRFVACFADIEEKGVYGGSKRDPEIKVATAPQAKQLAELEKQLTLLQSQLKGASQGEAVQKQVDAIKVQQANIEKQFVRTMITRSVEPKVIRVLPRGDWLNSSGPVVTPGVPAHFVKETDSREQRFTRLDLANWIVAKENPLTSRVFVNRLWKIFFGRGLSSRLDDLGIQGEWPTHPALLDYLSVRFVNSGWNVKQIIKLIVMSRTYQQSSTLRSIDTAADPTNLYFARQSRWRLEAEFIRDNVLSVSGLLDSTIGGPSVFPYQPSGYWRYLNFPTRTWKSDSGTSQYRRGLYTHWQRTLVHPAMLALDAPTREECTAMRSISNTPAAALTLLNDPTFVEAARALAVRVVQQGGVWENDKIRWLFLQVLSRPDTKQERGAVVQILQSAREHYADDPLAAAQLQTNGLFKLESTLDVIEVSAWTMACRVVLNLSETITRN